MNAQARTHLLGAVDAALGPEAAQPTGTAEPVLTRAVVLAEFADHDSRAVVRLALDAGGDDLPTWDASALLLHSLLEVLNK